jgi:hypothetical protein
MQDPKKIFFSERFAFYIHLQSISETFTQSYIKVCDIETVHDFWSILNNVPSCESLHSNLIFIDGKRVVAYSFFKENVKPEWEDSTNFLGSEWGCRENMSSDEFANNFISVALSLLNDEFSSAVGVRCINKSNRVRDLYKIEVWMSTSGTKKVMNDKCVLNRSLISPLNMKLLIHRDKHNRANEYHKKTKKKTLSDSK